MPPFPSEEFRARRARLFDAIGAEACALLQGAPPVRGFAVFRQTNEFHYLCGVEAPQAHLLLRGADRTAHLYVPSRGEGVSHEGEQLGAEDAEALRAMSGVDAVHTPDALEGDIRDARVVYTPHEPAEGPQGSRDELTRANRLVAADPWDHTPTREEAYIRLLRERAPSGEIRDLSPILDELRSVKSPREVAVAKRAGELAALATIEAMRATEPGMREFHLGAIALHVFLANGARGDGYRAIIASGPNAWYGHYFRNDAELREGDLVLFDYAPDYLYYTSDIGRMWPIGGTYSPLQRELYGFVVEYHKALLARIRPGRTAEEIHADAADAMRPRIEAWPWSKPLYRAAAEAMLTFQGHLSHPVGMAVHDVGGYRHKPLEPGVVLTVDPQMWVREEKRYIRCEDTIAVTEDGIDNFTKAAPLELDKVEALMREPGRYPKAPWG